MTNNQPIFDRFVQAEWDADWAWTVDRYGDEATIAQMPRTNAQRRADALSAIMRRAAGAPKGASGTGPKVVANVHIDWQNFQDLLAWAGPLDNSGYGSYLRQIADTAAEEARP